MEEESGQRPSVNTRPWRISIEERVKLLESTSWSDDFSGRELETFAKYLMAYKSRKGDCVVEEGDRKEFLCLVIEGNLNILKRGSTGKPKVVASVGPGSTFGEMSLIDHWPRSATVCAKEDCVLLTLSGTEFARLADDVPRLAFKLLLRIVRPLSQRLRRVTGILVDYLEE